MSTGACVRRPLYGGLHSETGRRPGLPSRQAARRACRLSVLPGVAVKRRYSSSKPEATRTTPSAFSVLGDDVFGLVIRARAGHHLCARVLESLRLPVQGLAGPCPEPWMKPPASSFTGVMPPARVVPNQGSMVSTALAFDSHSVHACRKHRQLLATQWPALPAIHTAS